MANGKDKFEEDLAVLLKRLSADMNEDAKGKLVKLKNDLVDLHRQNVVKINHSVMELVCAKYLIVKGYDVEVEYKLDPILTCDLYSTKGYGNLIVEIETGYIPPEHAMAPITYTAARLASKIVRYSSFAGKFAIGVPPHYVLPLPAPLAAPPKRRTAQDIESIKSLCDRFYQKPPVTAEGIQNARIQEIYLIDVDRLCVLEMDPEAYMKRALNKGVLFTPEDEAFFQEQKTAKIVRSEERIDHYMKQTAADAMAYFVYIIACKDGTFYTGYTKNVEQRAKLHACGRGARYTKSHPPAEVAYVESFTSRSEAMRREKAIKKLSHQQKQELIHLHNKTGKSRQSPEGKA